MKRWAALLVATVFPGHDEPEIPMATPADDAAGKKEIVDGSGRLIEKAPDQARGGK